MICCKYVTIDGREYQIVISDQYEALLAAKAAGRAVVGIMGKHEEQSFFEGIPYVAETWEAVDEEYLEQAVRRHLGLPWIIADTNRLLIREFRPEDVKQVPKEATDHEADRIFQEPGLLKEYIRCQYGFCGYGIWALVEKETGRIIGKAGVANAQTIDGLELGYHVFAPYTGRGLAKEGCQAILHYVSHHFPEEKIYAKIDPCNERSIHLAVSLGFRQVCETDIESVPGFRLYEWCC